MGSCHFLSLSYVPGAVWSLCTLSLCSCQCLTSPQREELVPLFPEGQLGLSKGNLPPRARVTI